MANIDDWDAGCYDSPTKVKVNTRGANPGSTAKGTVSGKGALSAVVGAWMAPPAPGPASSIPCPESSGRSEVARPAGASEEAGAMAMRAAKQAAQSRVSARSPAKEPAAAAGSNQKDAAPAEAEGEEDSCSSSEDGIRARRGAVKRGRPRATLGQVTPVKLGATGGGRGQIPAGKDAVAGGRRLDRRFKVAGKSEPAAEPESTQKQPPQVKPKRGRPCKASKLQVAGSEARPDADPPIATGKRSPGGKQGGSEASEEPATKAARGVIAKRPASRVPAPASADELSCWAGRKPPSPGSAAGQCFALKKSLFESGLSEIQASGAELPAKGLQAAHRKFWAFLTAQEKGGQQLPAAATNYWSQVEKASATPNFDLNKFEPVVETTTGTSAV